MARKQTKNTETRLQTFSITAPGASSVMLVGDFTHWQDKPINMVKRQGGLWTASVNLPPARIITVSWWTANGATTPKTRCACRIPTAARMPFVP